MNGDKIYCIMVTGPGINDDIRNILFDTAQEMVQKEHERKKVKGSKFEGRVTTHYEVTSLGGITGIVFNATIETDEVTHRINYLIRPCDLRAEDCAWISMESPGHDPSLN